MKRTFIVVTLLALCGCGGGSSRSEDVAHAPFDPNEHRAQIEAVEAILYKRGPADHSDVDRATSSLVALHESVLSRQTGATKRSRAHALLLMTSQASFTDVGYSSPDLSPLRERWEEVRMELFGPADWYRESTADVERAQAHPEPEIDPGRVYELSRVIDRLEDLIAVGRMECEELGEPVYEPGRVGYDGEVQIQQWNQFYRDWDERLSSAAEFLPPQPPLDGAADYLFAHQSVSRAFIELRLIPYGAGEWPTPFAYQWEQRFRAAEEHLNGARERLEHR